ncbi:hypothetical protein ACHHYP_20874 [Achlya hypogyna]|uniref:Uncharacterized protein n=1 Tax=Achlya hypogyna TaxID=1202772 RepID=A0A1V9Y486_ACHHY|nr:hypothetical protein ACHHYP_20874 [Achlya hypogyna]
MGWTDKAIRFNNDLVFIMKANSKRDFRPVNTDSVLTDFDDKLMKAYERPTHEEGQVLLNDSVNAQVRYILAA